MARNLLGSTISTPGGRLPSARYRPGSLDMAAQGTFAAGLKVKFPNRRSQSLVIMEKKMTKENTHDRLFARRDESPPSACPGSCGQQAARSGSHVHQWKNGGFCLPPHYRHPRYPLQLRPSCQLEISENETKETHGIGYSNNRQTARTSHFSN